MQRNATVRVNVPGDEGVVFIVLLCDLPLSQLSGSLSLSLSLSSVDWCSVRPHRLSEELVLFDYGVFFWGAGGFEREFPPSGAGTCGWFLPCEGPITLTLKGKQNSCRDRNLDSC